MKHTSLYLSIALALGLLAVASCSKSTYHEPVYAQADVPVVSTGSWWRYLVRDSVRNHTDTLTLSVASVTAGGTGYSAFCYVVDTGLAIDSGTLTVSDMQWAFSSAAGKLGNFDIRLPFSAGDSWVTTDSDAITVLPYQLDVKVQGLDYWVWDISRTRRQYDDTIRQHLQVSRNIGVVYQGYNYVGPAGAKRRFGAELIDYHF
ncbi:MAG: hypothetical protein JST83_15300 [Bacteroidetes bacterium]|nr:hypothetical protein [Bacteroidota bacterium]